MQLKTSCILNIPFQSYANDFSFIVNGEEFKTSRIVSDLLSPKICQIHKTDPTFSEITINTYNQGHFSYFLDLINFHKINPPKDELLFMREVIELLGNDSIVFNFPNIKLEITLENVFSLIQNHKKFVFNKRIEKLIEFMASHFSELCNKHKEELSALDIGILEKIMSNRHFQISDEDELINFINFLYKFDSKYSILYEHINFLNVTEKSILNFIEIFDMNDMTGEIWSKICVLINKMTKKSKRKQKKSIQISFNGSNELSGILKYIRNFVNKKIENEINITSLTCQTTNDEYYIPQNIAYFDNKKAFWSNDTTPNNWICIDFKSRRVIPTHYTIKTYGIAPNRHPRIWVVEGSKDNQNWTVLDEEKDCPYTKKSNSIHTFEIKQQKEKEFQFIRLRSTGKDWAGTNYLIIDSFELYGTLVL